jgi:hypothetical protein
MADERGLLRSKNLEQAGRGLIYDVRSLIVDMFSSPSAVRKVDGSHPRKTETRNPRKTLPMQRLKASLKNDAPLLGNSVYPSRLIRQACRKLVSGPKLLPAWQWIEILFLVLSTIAILYTINIILFLWLKRSAWRHDIALDDKATSIVTLQSTVLRFAVAVQATVFIFELGRSKHPQRNAQSLVPTPRNTSPKIPTYYKVVNTVLILFLAATTTASNFFTPLLLSDLGPKAVGRSAAPSPIYYRPPPLMRYPGHPQLYDNNLNGIPSTFKPRTREKLLQSEPDFSMLPPTLFPTFAEYANASTRDMQPGVDDTGAVIRALLPINDTTRRENLWLYNGFATLVNSRVVCVRPTVFDLRLGWDDRSNSTFIQGNLSVSAIRPSGIHHDRIRDPKHKVDFGTPIPFHCYLAVPDATGTDWPVSLCAVGSTTGQPRSPGGFGLQVNSPFNGKGQPRPYVMTNYTGSAPTNTSIQSPFSYSTNTSSISSPWTHIRWEELEDFEIRLSLCFPSFQAVDTRISADSSSTRSEPPLPKNPPAPFDSAPLLKQLGMGALLNSYGGDESDRGIMKLTMPNGKICECYFALDFTFGLSNRVFAKLNGDKGGDKGLINYLPHTYGLCAGSGRKMKLDEALVGGGASGGIGGVKQIDAVLAGIFMDALKTEGVGPAKALQALFWVLNAEQYYHRLPHFDERAPSTLSFFEDHILPVRKNGLWVMCAILGAHFLTVLLAAAVLLLRLKHKRRSDQGLGLGVDSSMGTFIGVLQDKEVGLAMMLQALFWVLNVTKYYRWTLYSGFSVFRNQVFAPKMNGLWVVCVVLGAYFLALLHFMVLRQRVDGKKGRYLDEKKE